MEQVKIAVKSKAGKNDVSKKTPNETSKQVDILNNDYGLNITIDHSIGKYASDPAFIEHARKVDQRFEKKS